MIGERLGKYTILEPVGTGSMGVVYKAEDTEQHRLVAVKLVRANVLYSAERRERFLQCLLAASEVRHPAVCPILEIGDDNDDFFVVMPFLEDVRLDQLMDGRPLSWRRALDIALGIADGLAAIHATGVAHRGLKPANVWLDESGGVVLSDCCVARFTEIPKSSRKPARPRRVDFADTIIPNSALAYMSPEQVRGSVLDERTDIFSLGVILYEMLTGKHPFEARHSLSRMSAILEGLPPAPSTRVAAIPHQLDPILERAMAKRPGDRYQSVAAMASALKEVRETCVSVRRERSRRRLRRAQVLFIASVLALLACLALYVVIRF
jgi:serine/threonine protein kinase